MAAFARPAAAHAGGLSGSFESAAIPFWLVVLSGGGIVAGSFLFTALITDHEAIRIVNGLAAGLPSAATVRAAGGRLLGAAGVVGLVAVVAAGLVGPATASRNAAVLVVWAGWWAGYTMTVYGVGDTWPALNPWRALARALPRIGDETYPRRFGTWPSVAGLLALVWLEVVSPVAQRPRVLAATVVVYSVVTVTGAAVYGPDAWFRSVDPVARVFRWYGRMAPVQRTDDGIELRLPGAALVGSRVADGLDDTAFVVALLWVTTYDGLVSTPPWRTAVRAVVGVGVPPLLVYLVAILAGFWLFLAAYRVAAGYARRTADTYVTPAFIRDWFVPALVPIAAGYHLAHFLGYFISLVPSLATVLARPLSPPANPPLAVLPEWFGGVQLAFVVLGHLLAVWVAHARAFELFTGRLQPVRSQYPFIVVMILYTMTSMWIIAQPYVPPPYL